MEAYVFDSSALLVFYQNEPAAKLVEELLVKAKSEKIKVFLSEISLGEIYYISIRNKGIDQARSALANALALPIELVEVNRDSILEAAEIKSRGGLSYADCFVVQLAKTRAATVVTGDPEFKKFEKEIKILWL